MNSREAALRIIRALPTLSYDDASLSILLRSFTRVAVVAAEWVTQVLKAEDPLPAVSHASIMLLKTKTKLSVSNKTRLRAGLKLGIDVFILSVADFKIVHDGFGGDSIIEVPVFCILKKFVATYRVDLYPALFKTISTDPNGNLNLSMPVHVFASLSQTLIELKERICYLLCIDQNTEVRLHRKGLTVSCFFSFDPKTTSIVAPSPKLKQVGLVDGDTIYVEVILANGNWPFKSSQSSSGGFVSGLKKIVKSDEIVDSYLPKQPGTYLTIPLSESYMSLSAFAELTTLIRDKSVPEPFTNYEIVKAFQRGEFGMCGLDSIGKTSFMNAILQCLLHIPEFVQYYLAENYLLDVDMKSYAGSKGEISKYLAEVVKSYWCGRYASFKPQRFLCALKKYFPHFLNKNNSDPNVFLQILLTVLHEDTNAVLSSTTYSVEPSEVPSPSLAAKAETHHNKARSFSYISRLFYNIIRKTTLCPDCGYSRVTLDPSFSFSLPFPSSFKTSFDVVVIKFGYQPMVYALPSHDYNAFLLKKTISSMAKLDENRLSVACVYLNKIYTLYYDVNTIIPLGERVYVYELPFIDKPDEVQFEQSESFESVNDLENPKKGNKNDKKIKEKSLKTPKNTSSFLNCDSEVYHSCLPQDYVLLRVIHGSLQEGKSEKTIFGHPILFPLSPALTCKELYQLLWRQYCLYLLEHFPRAGELMQVKVSEGNNVLDLASPLNVTTEEVFLLDAMIDEMNSCIKIERKYEEKKENEKDEVIQDIDNLTEKKKSKKKENAKKTIIENKIEKENVSEVNAKYPFILRVTKRLGNVCAICPKTASCEGCILPFDSSHVRDYYPTSPLMFTVLIEWNSVFATNEFQERMVQVINNQSKIEAIEKAKTNENISLDALLKNAAIGGVASGTKDWLCPKCQEHKNPITKNSLWKAPKILVIHLQRFRRSASSRSTITSSVNCPVDWDIREHIEENDEKNNEKKKKIQRTQFTLSGVVMINNNLNKGSLPNSQSQVLHDFCSEKDEKKQTITINSYSLDDLNDQSNKDEKMRRFQSMDFALIQNTQNSTNSSMKQTPYKKSQLTYQSASAQSQSQSQGTPKKTSEHDSLSSPSPACNVYSCIPFCGRWYVCKDNSVTETMPIRKQIKSDSAYILFYVQKREKE